MTIPSTTRKAGPLLGTSAQTAWPFTFKVFAEGDIRVVVVDDLSVETDMVLNTDYSVALNSNQETSPGGTVTYPLSGSPLATGSALTIVGDLDYDQPLDLPAGGNFSPTALENELDRIVMQVQQLRETLNRALLAPVTSAASGQLPAPEANTLIGWNSAEDALQNVPLTALVTAQTYGSFTNDAFTGTGAQTSFALSANPITLSNVQVFVDGLALIAGTDYTLASSNVIFTVAPTLNAEIIARFGQALVATGMAASDVSFAPSGTIAATTVQAALVELDTDKAKVGPLAASGITGAAESGANTTITSLASPALGAATATTQAASDASTKVATMAAVNSTGRAVQTVEATPYATYTAITTPFIPVDDTIPQITEGTEILTVTITPKSATNRLRIEADGSFGANGSTVFVTMALFQDATANALACEQAADNLNISARPIHVRHEMAAGTTSATTFRIRVGSESGTCYINGIAAARRYGGALAVRLRVTELAA